MRTSTSAATHWIGGGLLSLAIAGLLSGTVGCEGGNEYQEFSSGDIKPADPGAHDHSHDHGEHHKAPHGGSLVELGDHQYHAEIAWDEKAKTITVYVLDGEAEKAVAIDATELELAIGTGDDAKRHKLAAQPQDGDGEGKSSRFVTADKTLFETFHDNDSATGEIQLPIGDKSFPLAVTHKDHDHEHGDHDHGNHKHDKDGDHKHDDKAGASKKKKSGPSDK
jgi:hypothetical protein